MADGRATKAPQAVEARLRLPPDAELRARRARRGRPGGRARPRARRPAPRRGRRLGAAEARGGPAARRAPRRTAPTSLRPRAPADAEVFDRPRRRALGPEARDLRLPLDGQRRHRRAAPSSRSGSSSSTSTGTSRAGRRARRRSRTSASAGSPAEVNDAAPNTPDYEIPPGFRLREHAQSRQAWELGDGDAVEAVVEFRRAGRRRDGRRAAGRAGAPATRTAAGSASAGATPSRAGCSRFAGDVAPVAPAELVAEYRRCRADARGLPGEPVA